MSSPAPHTLEAILLAAAFAVAHTQSPLYFSNQNQYLLHGAASGGHGHLAHDWLATTRDPTPLFSALVAVAYATVGPWLLQPAYFAMLMGYFLAARWLVAVVPGFPDTRAARIAFAALFTLAHAAILRWGSVQLTGGDYPWLLQAGLAAQYLVGPGIQPSAFGVLLLVAVAAFAHGRVVLASAVAALACWFHSTYLLPAGLLVFGFLYELTRGRSSRTAVVAGAVALATVAPVIAFTIWRFDPFGTDTSRAVEILARTRIPHHAVPARWFDELAAFQLAWVAVGLFLVRRTPFGRALVVAAVGGALLTALQLATASDRLALMFPWRVSVLLVPVATAVIVAKLLAWWFSPSPLAGEGSERSERVRGEAIRATDVTPDSAKLSAPSPGSLREPPSPSRGEGKTKATERIALVLLVALVAGGVIVTAGELGYQMVDERAIYDHIRATATPDDVYLLPVQFPAVGSGRGAVSNTFAPAPRAKPGTTQIPVDLQRFRLATGARIYVDFKSVPYAAAEVEEWYRRMQFASELSAKGAWDAPDLHAKLNQEGITHVVWPRTKPLAVGYLEPVHSDDAYTVYRVK